MKNLTPYLFFDGRCKEALDFYSECLSGEITFLQTFAEGSEGAQPGMENRVMHANFNADNVAFMASDTMPDADAPKGSAITLCLDFSDPDEQARVFHELGEGGEVTMALQDTFWGARFGMVTDKFGISWMVNYDKK